VSLAARPLRAGEDPARWLAAALADVHVRKIRHPGCHRYAFPLGTRRQRAAVAIAPRPASYLKKYLGQLSLSRIAQARSLRQTRRRRVHGERNRRDRATGSRQCTFTATDGRRCISSRYRRGYRRSRRQRLLRRTRVSAD
jgi:hypothetical protein